MISMSAHPNHGVGEWCLFHRTGKGGRAKSGSPAWGLHSGGFSRLERLNLHVGSQEGVGDTQIVTEVPPVDDIT